MKKISGYTTTRNCLKMDYPFIDSIRSMSLFCDEIIVLDYSDKNDETIEALKQLRKELPMLRLYHVDIDLNAPNFGVYDGILKAAARKKCNYEFLWQFDVDEVVNESDGKRLKKFIFNMEQKGIFESTSLVAFPIIDFWGKNNKIRLDTNPFKPRLSKNIPNITHGIPVQLRKIVNGVLYAKQGTDGCDYIDENSGEPILCLVPDFTQEIVELKRKAMFDYEARMKYQEWFNKYIEIYPSIFHYSWYDIERKLKNYKMFWSNSWCTLYGEKKRTMVFNNKDWDNITDEEIKNRARELEEIGGWIFHKEWNGEKTGWISLVNNKELPKLSSWNII